MINSIEDKIVYKYVTSILNCKKIDMSYLKNNYGILNAEKFSYLIIKKFINEFDSNEISTDVRDCFRYFVLSIDNYSADMLLILIENYTKLFENNDQLLIERLKRFINIKDKKIIETAVKKSIIFSCAEISSKLFLYLSLDTLFTHIKTQVASVDRDSHYLCDICLRCLRKFCKKMYIEENLNKECHKLCEVYNVFLQEYRKIISDSTFDIHEITTLFTLFSNYLIQPKLLFNYGLLLKIIGDRSSLKELYILLFETEKKTGVLNYSTKLGIQILDEYSDEYMSFIYENSIRDNDVITTNVKSIFDSLCICNATNFNEHNKIIKNISINNLSINEYGLLLRLWKKKNLNFTFLFEILYSHINDIKFDDSYLSILPVIANSDSVEISRAYDLSFRVRDEKFSSLLNDDDLYIVLSSNPNKYELYNKTFPGDVLYISDKLSSYYTYFPDELIKHIADKLYLDLKKYKRLILIGGSKAGHGALCLANRLVLSGYPNRIIVFCFSPQINLNKPSDFGFVISERFSSLRFYKNICCEINSLCKNSFIQYSNLEEYSEFINNPNVFVNIFISANNFFDNLELMPLANYFNYSNVFIFRLPGNLHNTMQFFNFDFFERTGYIENKLNKIPAITQISKYFSTDIYDYL